MATRSKVWPVLVKNSLNLGSMPVIDLSPPPRSSQQVECISYRAEPIKATGRWRSLVDSIIKINYKQVTSYLARYLLKQCTCDRAADNSVSCSFCGPGTSDILCVAGAITAITGSFVAGFGVFPKNQARIRLYLECFGCAMIIVGMLIVFLSQKMQPTRRVEDDRDDVRRNPRSSQKLVTDRRTNRSFLSRSSSANSDGKSNQHSARLEMSSPFWNWRPNKDSCQQADCISAPPAPIERLEIEVMPNEGVLAVRAVSDDALAGSSRRNATSSDGAFNDDGSRWIPDDDDGYGLDHQAAIETVLSTVLTVSTLVGFRSHQTAQNYCCLHHAIQHKISAQRWLNRLRVSRNQLTVSQRDLRLAETTFIEDPAKRGAANTAEMTKIAQQYCAPMRLVEFNKPGQLEGTDATLNSEEIGLPGSIPSMQLTKT